MRKRIWIVTRVTTTQNDFALINIRSDYLHCWLACFNSLERLRESLLSKYTTSKQLSRELVSVALRYLINSYPSKLRWTIFVAALTFCRINMSWDFRFQFRCLLSSVPVPYLVHSNNTSRIIKTTYRDTIPWIWLPSRPKFYPNRYYYIRVTKRMRSKIEGNTHSKTTLHVKSTHTKTQSKFPSPAP